MFKIKVAGILMDADNIKPGLLLFVRLFIIMFF